MASLRLPVRLVDLSESELQELAIAVGEELTRRRAHSQTAASGAPVTTVRIVSGIGSGQEEPADTPSPPHGYLAATVAPHRAVRLGAGGAHSTAEMSLLQDGLQGSHTAGGSPSGARSHLPVLSADFRHSLWPRVLARSQSAEGMQRRSRQR